MVTSNYINNADNHRIIFLFEYLTFYTIFAKINQTNKNMEKKIKLRPKQLSAITEIQNQKQQLSKMFQDLNEKESLLVTLIFEAADLDVNTVNGVRLDGEFIAYSENFASNETPKVVAPVKDKIKKKIKDKVAKEQNESIS